MLAALPILLLLLVAPVLAFAGQAASLPASLPSDPGGLLSFFVTALHSGKSGLVVAAVLAVLVWLLKSTNLGQKLPKAYWPWLATLTSVLGALGANLSGGMPWGDALWQGLVVGKAAVGLWESTLQHLVAWVAKKFNLSQSPPAA
jgi:uncharacterized membrane protein